MMSLHMIRDHVTASYHIDRDDLEYAPFERMVVKHRSIPPPLKKGD